MSRARRNGWRTTRRHAVLSAAINDAPQLVSIHPQTIIRSDVPTHPLSTKVRPERGDVPDVAASTARSKAAGHPLLRGYIGLICPTSLNRTLAGNAFAGGDGLVNIAGTGTRASCHHERSHSLQDWRLWQYFSRRQSTIRKSWQRRARVTRYSRSALTST